MIRDNMIYKFLRERGGKASNREILEGLGSDEESRRLIEEKLTIMERFGIVIIDGDVVRIKQMTREFLGR